jgi:hypothetical protein
VAGDTANNIRQLEEVGRIVRVAIEPGKIVWEGQEVTVTNTSGAKGRKRGKE